MYLGVHAKASSSANRPPFSTGVRACSRIGVRASTLTCVRASTLTCVRASTLTCERGFLYPPVAAAATKETYMTHVSMATKETYMYVVHVSMATKESCDADLPQHVELAEWTRRGVDAPPRTGLWPRRVGSLLRQSKGVGNPKSVGSSTLLHGAASHWAVRAPQMTVGRGRSAGVVCTASIVCTSGVQERLRL